MIVARFFDFVKYDVQFSGREALNGRKSENSRKNRKNHEIFTNFDGFSIISIIFEIKKREEDRADPLGKGAEKEAKNKEKISEKPIKCRKKCDNSGKKL